MANSAKTLFRGAASLSNTTLYTVPAATTAVVTNIVIANTAATAATVTLKFDGVDAISSLSVSGNSSVVIDMKQVLTTTKIVAGSASAITVNFHISGMEIA
jgi:hypothetical protein